MTAAKKIKSTVFIWLKHGIWYLVIWWRGIKIWCESLLIGGFFLVVGKRMSTVLAGAGLLPIPCPIRENPPMLSQFGPKLENLMMILCKAFFHLSILLSWRALL